MTVVEERPYEVTPEGREPAWIYDFALEYGDPRLDFAEVSDLVEEAFIAVWSGLVGDDGLNRLVLGAGMKSADVAILRAYSSTFTRPARW